MGQNNTDKNNILIVARTPQQLEQELARKSQSEILAGKNIILVLDDKRCCVRTFAGPQLSAREIEQYLSTESMELLNLTASEIIVDFQVTTQADGKIQGIFACIPRAALAEYMPIWQQYDLAVLSIVPGPLARLEVLQAKGELSVRRLVFVDFSIDHEFDILILNGDHVELLRRCPFENESQALQEVDRSLKSVCSQSSQKTLEKVYVAGQTSRKRLALRETEKHFETKIEQVGSSLLEGVGSGFSSRLFSINLARRTYLQPKTKQLIRRGLNAALAVCLVVVAGFGIQVIYNHLVITYWKNAIVQARK